MNSIKTYFNWSSGKDASMALNLMLQEPQYSIEKLITSVNRHYQRVSMHGLRIELLQRQAESIGIPLQLIELPEQPSMEDYNQIMLKTVNSLKDDGFTCCGFGDIFLEDLRKYREDQLAQHQIKTVFPLWKKDTSELIRTFIDQGFKAITVCCDAQLLGEEFVGREIDLDFVNDLPDNVDPCGENGEFHTFCFDGPIFKEPISFEIDEKIYKEYDHPGEDNDLKMGFWFCDLI